MTTRTDRTEPVSIPDEQAVDDAISAWHMGSYSGTLPNFLGWSMAEYVAWVGDPLCIPQRPLPDPPEQPS